MRNSLAQKIRKLAKRITKVEGKKSQVSYGNVLEVLRVMTALEAADMMHGKPYAGRPSQIMETYTIFAINKAYKIMAKKKKPKKKVRVLRKKTARRKK